MDQVKRRRVGSSAGVRHAIAPPAPDRSAPCPIDGNPRVGALLGQADAAFARSLRRSSIPKGKDVVIGGSRGDCVYVNHDGWLARYKTLHKGTRQILDFILPGQVFGLPACVFQCAPYSVVTVTRATLSAVPFGLVDTMFDQEPALAKALFWSTIYDAAILGEHLVDAGRRSAYERVSHLLLELLVRLNRTRPTTKMTFSMPLTQELVADALGLTTVHVNRTFRKLRDDGLIEVDGRSIRIISFEALSLLSDFEQTYLNDARP